MEKKMEENTIGFRVKSSGFRISSLRAGAVYYLRSRLLFLATFKVWGPGFGAWGVEQLVH